MLYTVVTLQAYARGRNGRRHFQEVRKGYNATRLQKLWCMMHIRRRFLRRRSAVVALQCRLRCRRAKYQLRELRIAAKDVGNLQQNNEDLKREIELLREAAAQQSEEKAREEAAKAKAQAIEEARVQREAEQKQMEQHKAAVEAERAAERAATAAMQAELERVKNELQLQGALNATQEIKPQAETDALYAEISMLKDLLSGEREAKAQVEADLMEALGLLSAERKTRLDLETKMESIGSSGSASGRAGSPSGESSAELTPMAVSGTWHNVPSPMSPASGIVGVAAPELKQQQPQPQSQQPGDMAGLSAFDDPAKAAMSTPQNITSVAGLFGVLTEPEGTAAAAAGGGAVTTGGRRKSAKKRSSTPKALGDDDDDDDDDDEDEDEDDVHEQLANERSIRACLEEEVTRLRLQANAATSKDAATTRSGVASAAAPATQRQASGELNLSSLTGRDSNPGTSSLNSAGTASNSESVGSGYSAAKSGAGGTQLEKFYNSLSIFHNKMLNGIHVYLWEGADLNHKIEVKMTLNAGIDHFYFAEPKSRRKTILPAAAAAWFAPKIAIPNMNIDDIFECLPGGDDTVFDSLQPSEREHAEGCLLTIVTKSDGPRPRTVLLMLGSREERNTLMSGMRMMQSATTTMLTLHEHQQAALHPHLSHLANPGRNLSLSERAQQESDLLATPKAVSTSMPSTSTEPAAAASAAAAAATAKATQAAAALTPPPPPTSTVNTAVTPTPTSTRKITRPVTRRMSKRDEILSATRRAAGSTPTATPATPAAAAPASANATGAATATATAAKTVDLSSYERVLNKNLTLTNELNDREGEIIAMKKKEQVHKETLKAKERMYEQDANVRMQLGRRLEQILLDKEEAKDEIDDLKAHVSKLEMMIVDHAQVRAELEAEKRGLLEQQVAQLKEAAAAEKEEPEAGAVSPDVTPDTTPSKVAVSTNITADTAAADTAAADTAAADTAADND